MTENLQRAELDPIDEAAALLSFHQARHEEMDLDTEINALITLDRDPSRVDPEGAATVAAIHEI